ncbi:MAG: type II toxin-antitoxin system ParD family antitoxin [Novosphingobium sp.]|nr:type II toxin-antitoxin system ParD family antitoxin [Novosphingobium sp.]
MMGKFEKLSVEIPAELLDSAKSAVAGGEFLSIEEVVSTALRTWQEKRESNLARLRALIDEGYQSGFAPWEGADAIIAEGRRRLAERQA